MSFFEHGKELPLWEKLPPLSLGTGEHDIPTIKAFLPPAWKRNGRALVVFPGGGYGHYGEHEGDGYSEFFAAHGYCCFTVRYRLGKYGYHHPVELSDAARAVRLARLFADECGFDASRVGAVGSSAGGHLAATLGNIPDEALCAGDASDAMPSRPDWTVLCYPVITFRDPYSTYWTRKNLCGTDAPSPEITAHLSCDETVSEATPPSFLWHTFEDGVVPVENSMLFAAALRRNKIPFELHIYERGGHGQGLFEGHPWSAECLRWMEQF